MHDKTECKYSYEPIKSGRKVTAIHFTIETVSDRVQALADQSEDSTKQLTFADTYSDYEEEKEPINYGSDLADLLGEVCDNEFSPQQIRVIQDLVLQYIGNYPDNHIKCADYLIHKMHLLDYYKAKDRYRYLIKMINNDIKDPDSAL